MYRYDFKNNYLECMGEYITDTLDIVDPYSAFGLVFDENGVMWYAILMHDEYYSVVNAYLCRWDILNGKKPQNMGLLGTPERSLTVCSEMEYHNGILYVADSNHNFDVPGVFTVDLRKLDALQYSLSDDDIPYTKDIMNYMILENPRKFYKYSMEEYDRQEEHNSHYFKYIEEYNGFLNDNPINMVSDEVEVYSIWKEYTYAKSQVKNVRFEDDSVIAEFGNDTEKFSLYTNPYSVKSIDAYSVCEKVTEKINMPELSAAAGSKDRLGMLYVLSI